jgi:hypothetical protein
MGNTFVMGAVRSRLISICMGNRIRIRRENAPNGSRGGCAPSFKCRAGGISNFGQLTA